MTPRLRKLALTAHITSSVGWLGAVAGFLALAVAGLTSQNTQMVAASYIAMNVIAWSVILPLAVASLLTGIIQSLITKWGLIRHFWVLAKLLLTLFATVILLLKMNLISSMARVAAGASMSVADLRQAKVELIIHSGGGLFILLVITALSVFKPWGRTRYGRQREREGAAPIATPTRQESQHVSNQGRTPRLKIALVFVGVIVVAFVFLHFTGIHGHHGQ